MFKEMVLNFVYYGRAGKSAFGFQRNGSVLGRIFSYMPSLMKLAPGPSGFKAVRKHALDLHYNIRVIVFIKFMFTKFNYKNSKLSQQDIILEQYNTYSEKHDRHFVDMYIKEIKANRETFSSNLTLLWRDICNLLTNTSFIVYIKWIN